MYRLYFDTCFLNDFFALMQNELSGPVRGRDVKIPLVRWTPPYIASYYILNLDDQWQLEFGTSEITQQEIARWQPRDQVGREKKEFLGEVYRELKEKWHVSSNPVSQALIGRVVRLFGPGLDALHICRAIEGGWDFFITLTLELFSTERARSRS